MGLAASQARLLTLTSRMSDLELRSMQLSNQKMILANRKDDVYEKYSNAISNRTLKINNVVNNTQVDFTYANLKSLLGQDYDIELSPVLTTQRTRNLSNEERMNLVQDQFGSFKTLRDYMTEHFGYPRYVDNNGELELPDYETWLANQNQEISEVQEAEAEGEDVFGNNSGNSGGSGNGATPRSQRSSGSSTAFASMIYTNASLSFAEDFNVTNDNNNPTVVMAAAPNGDGSENPFVDGNGNFYATQDSFEYWQDPNGNWFGGPSGGSRPTPPNDGPGGSGGAGGGDPVDPNGGGDPVDPNGGGEDPVDPNGGGEDPVGNDEPDEPDTSEYDTWCGGIRGEYNGVKEQYDLEYCNGNEAAWVEQCLSQVATTETYTNESILNNPEALIQAILNGLAFITKNGQRIDGLPKEVSNIADESDDEPARIVYDREMNALKTKETRIDNEITKNNTEHQACETQIDSIKKIMQDNMERTMNIFA